MPRYDYQCEGCGHVFEITRKRTEPGPGECPECGAADPTKLISATSFKLKGSGWYVTDYRSPGKTRGAGTMPEPITDSNVSKAESDATSSDSSASSDAGTSGDTASDTAPTTSEND